MTQHSEDSMTHDPRDVETVARVLCEAMARDPEEEMPSGMIRDFALVQCAHRMMDALQDKGWKITSRDTWEHGPSGVYAGGVWEYTHDAAPIVPRGDA